MGAFNAEVKQREQVLVLEEQVQQHHGALRVLRGFGDRLHGRRHFAGLKPVDAQRDLQHFAVRLDGTVR
ncbi:hypothetical protein D3C73_1558280 [compost metagenome]